MAWSALDVAVNRTGNFALGVIVARLLAPHDFGVYAVALVVHSILINVSELGVSTALLRDDSDRVEAAAPTVATIAIVSSVALGGLMVLSAPLFARLLGAPDATTTIQVMALTLPLAGIAAVPSALLQRNFRMDRMFVANSANVVASAVIVIPLAIAGCGPLALAYSFVAGQVLTTVMVHIYSPARYRPGWDWRQARRLLGFGAPLVGANVLGYLILNVDYIVVGRLLGPVPLGLYLLAFNISGWPQNVLSVVVRNVSVPAFARLHQSGGDASGQFSTSLRMLSRITFPVCLFLGALAHPLILAVYGDKWSGASKALLGLAFLAAARTVIELFSDFLVSLGRTRAVLLVQVVWLPALTLALFLLVQRFGIAGAGAAHALVSGLIVIPLLIWLVGRAGVSRLVAARSLLWSLSWASLTAVVAWLVASQVSNALLACAAGCAAGLTLYLLPYLAELRQAVTDEIARRRSCRPAVAEPAT